MRWSASCEQIGKKRPFLTSKIQKRQKPTFHEAVTPFFKWKSGWEGVIDLEIHSGFVYALSTHQQRIQDEYHKLYKKSQRRAMQIIDVMWL